MNIVVAGEAGQGIETAGKIIAHALHKKGFHVFFLPEYMSRIKGGCNSCLVKVDEIFAPYFEKKIDILFKMNKCAVEHLSARINKETLVIETPQGNNNFWAIGAALKMFEFNFDDIKALIGDILDKKDNLAQLENGFKSDIKRVNLKTTGAKGEFISCNDALSLGCVNGGCNFIAFYPMSPSTVLSTYMCSQEGVISEQVEDEICAINMALGASYAGARAMVSTAGGGFALMCEGVSLAGMSETPIVIHLAQRPAPATGLPTRDAQEDLNLALYAGHGEFPRIILSPSTPENAFEIGTKAFNLADKFQVPVFILTQQSFLESEFETQPLNKKISAQSHIIKSKSDYKRYSFDCGIISPRSLPNFGDGLVCVDSDEHDELGRITEDFEVRKKMNTKRLLKLDSIKEELENNPVGFIFSGIGENLIISWGGNYNVIQAVLRERDNFSHLHIMQLYPLQKRILDYIQNAKTVNIIEQNATGQFAELLKKEFSVIFHKKFLKYTGEPLSFGEVEEFLNEF